MRKRFILAASVVALVLVAALVVIYFLGTPVADGDPSPDVAKVVPAAADSSPLAIEIPGCVCHSDDPKLVEEHAAYRMSQCSGCHEGGAPTGQ